MALIVSAASGNFNNGATWVGGVVPGIGDEARADNGHTVTITANVTCDELSNAGTGIFTLNDGVTLTANVTSKSTTTGRNCLQFTAASPASATIVGNCTGGSVSDARAVVNTSTGTLTITGNCTGGSAGYALGANNNSTGTLTITGNCTGGSGASYAGGAWNNSTGTLTITGNCTGGTGSIAIGAWNESTGTLTIIGNCAGGPGSSAMGARNQAAGALTIIGNCTGGSNSDSNGANNNLNGTLTITGNCTGGTGNGSSGTNNSGNGTITITGNCTGGSNSTGYGARNGSTGTITIIGSAIGGSAAAGAFNNSTGLLTVTRAVGNGWGIGSVGLNSVPGVQSNLSGSQTRVEELEFGALGQSPIAGAVSVPDLSTNVCLVHRLSASKKTLIDPSANTGQANQSDVRAGTSYALGNRVGTLAVPAANQVAVGVAVDNTVGTAVLTESTLRAAIGLANANLDAQLITIQTIDNNVDAVNSVVNSIDQRLPAALVSGRIDAHVGAMAANTLTASALATDAVSEIANAVGTSNAQQSTLLQVKAKTDLITSTTNFITVERVAGSTITMHYQEATTATVGLNEDTSSLTLRFVVENSDQLDVLVIENANITRTASNFTVTITTALTATLGQYRWALRDITGGVNRLIEGGVLQVVSAANKDA